MLFTWPVSCLAHAVGSSEVHRHGDIADETQTQDVATSVTALVHFTFDQQAA